MVGVVAMPLTQQDGSHRMLDFFVYQLTSTIVRQSATLKIVNILQKNPVLSDTYTTS